MFAVNRRKFLKSLPILGFGFLVSSCATNKVQWEDRVGEYTYDQAVLEMGPPDKEARLENGTRVCEWRTSKGGISGMGTGSSLYMGPYGNYPQAFTASQMPDSYLRLTFSPESKLIDFKKVRR
jgi:hypothetical protein